MESGKVSREVIPEVEGTIGKGSAAFNLGKRQDLCIVYSC